MEHFSNKTSGKLRSLGSDSRVSFFFLAVLFGWGCSTQPVKHVARIDAGKTQQTIKGGSSGQSQPTKVEVVATQKNVGTFRATVEPLAGSAQTVRMDDQGSGAPMPEITFAPGTLAVAMDVQIEMTSDRMESSAYDILDVPAKASMVFGQTTRISSPSLSKTATPFELALPYQDTLQLTEYSDHEFFVLFRNTENGQVKQLKFKRDPARPGYLIVHHDEFGEFQVIRVQKTTAVSETAATEVERPAQPSDQNTNIGQDATRVGSSEAEQPLQDASKIDSVEIGRESADVNMVGLKPVAPIEPSNSGFYEDLSGIQEPAIFAAENIMAVEVTSNEAEGEDGAASGTSELVDPAPDLEVYTPVLHEQCTPAATCAGWAGCINETYAAANPGRWVIYEILETSQNDTHIQCTFRMHDGWPEGVQKGPIFSRFD